ncbi:MAG: CoB--CoM heterodisulfide reductase iron-sulfur subunit A family protein [Candidatus Thermoplasmatota archaeon]|nr:CoB--CoM heterodisulfide reductase iron-sulfur subunit A family protein [Candidatus Thermoplasmatota archaeon]
MNIEPSIHEFGGSKELPEERHDVMVVGGGICGMQAALDMGDMGFKVLLVEKEPSIGGVMYKLSKTFPTLDCSSCISTPRMASTAHHKNITMLTYSEVKEAIKEGEGNFRVRILEKPRYVDSAACTACSLCEKACPVIVPSEYDGNLSGRKAAFIPFDTALPKVAMIDLDNCIYCGACERACPVGCIDFLQTPKLHTARVRSVILATGFRLFDAKLKPTYHYGEYPNVITSMQMERYLSPTRPTHAIVRPSDGKEPGSIAYVLCVGSRDDTVKNPYCSQVCCMYSIKQAQLLMGALPLADIAIYYIDIRAFGKGFEEFYVQTKAMGVNFVKGKIAKIEQQENGDLTLFYEDIENGGRLSKSSHDLVVLAVGIMPGKDVAGIFKNDELKLDPIGWIKSPDEAGSPMVTSIRGVFAAGTAIGPKDIPDSAVEGSGAAIDAVAYLWTLDRERTGAEKKGGPS